MGQPKCSDAPCGHQGRGGGPLRNVSGRELAVALATLAAQALTEMS